MIRTAFSISLLLMIVAAPAVSDDYGPVPRQIPQGTTAPRIMSPPGPVYSLGTPSPQRPSINVHKGHFGHPQAPAAPAWSGYGFGGIPTYQWGYFGARYHAVKIYHRGYYGHRMSHGYRRGY